MDKDFDIKNINKLIKDLDKLGINVKGAIKNSVTRTGNLCTATAKLKCPVDKGDLRASIHTENNDNGKEISSESTTNVEYASHVEFGTGPAGAESNTNTEVQVHYKADKWLVKIPNVGYRYTKGQRSQPFMYPAYLKTRDKLLPNIKKELDKVLKGAGQ